MLQPTQACASPDRPRSRGAGRPWALLATLGHTCTPSSGMSLGHDDKYVLLDLGSRWMAEKEQGTLPH